MTILTNILYWISTSFLIPVIVILLIAFAASLLLLGGFYGQYMNRMKHAKRVRDIIEEISSGTFSSIEEGKPWKSKNLFAEYLGKMFLAGWSGIHSEKILADYEIEGEKELGLSRTLMRIGPMLGLMGTLIPMGPALVGLAAGDIGSMAVNMQVAFSTTVVGVFIGVIGYLTQLVKQRWHVEDMNNLQYIYALMSERGHGRE